MIKPNTIDPEEIAKFEAMAEEWWDPKGKFKPLHVFNPTRIAYIREQVVAHFGLDTKSLKPFEKLDILDIGCGGGLLSEPIARMGANLTSIDASEKNIAIASLHAEKEGLDIDYQATTAEALAAEGKQYDVILNMEVIEHVADVELFMEACCKLVKPGGLMFVATLNRTAKSFAFAIVGTEYVLRWLPRGTHDWRKFLRPSEITTRMEQGGMSLKTQTGVSFNPITSEWSLSSDMAVNFMLLGEKADT